MALSRRGGLSGKECTVCGIWKRLSDYPADRRPGRFKGYKQSVCIECTRFMKTKKIGR